MEQLVETLTGAGAEIGLHISEEENNRRLSASVIKALHAADLHQLYKPQSLGGVEADPLTTARLVEATAMHNTAAGWYMMVANVSTWWCWRLGNKGVEEIYSQGNDPIIAGAFHPSMAATPVDGGFLINGRSPLASNVHASRWIFVTAMVMEQGHPKMNNGHPEMLGVFMKYEECKVIDTWYTIGMKATDSNDIEAKNVFVPLYLSYPLVPEFEANSYYSGPLYKFPALGASIACLIAPVALAVATNAIAELKNLASKKTSFGSVTPLRERGSVQKKLGMAEALVQSSRSWLHQTISKSWEKTLSGQKLTLEEKATLLLAAAHTNQNCVQAVDMMYSAAGSSAIYTSNKLAHYFMDAQVIRQHGFANESRYETAAQVFLGLQPDLPVLAF